MVGRRGGNAGATLWFIKTVPRVQELVGCAREQHAGEKERSRVVAGGLTP